MSKWIKVEDQLPTGEDLKLVWAVTKKGVGNINRAWFDGRAWHGSGSMAGVTHWMDLPTPPGMGEDLKPARWVEKVVNGVGWWKECSECGAHWMLDSKTYLCKETPFCPNCGAKMEGGGEA